MRRKLYTEDQIIKASKQHESGASVLDVIEQTFYKWKAKFGGMDVSDAKRLKTLDEENTKLKKLLVNRCGSIMSSGWCWQKR